MGKKWKWDHFFFFLFLTWLINVCIAFSDRITPTRHNLGAYLKRIIYLSHHFGGTQIYTTEVVVFSTSSYSSAIAFSTYSLNLLTSRMVWNGVKHFMHRATLQVVHKSTHYFFWIRSVPLPQRWMLQHNFPLSPVYSSSVKWGDFMLRRNFNLPFIGWIDPSFTYGALCFGADIVATRWMLLDETEDAPKRLMTWFSFCSSIVTR